MKGEISREGELKMSNESKWWVWQWGWRQTEFIDQKFKLDVDPLLLKALVGECDCVDCLFRYKAEQTQCVIGMEQEQRTPENPAYPPELYWIGIPLELQRCGSAYI